MHVFKLIFEHDDSCFFAMHVSFLTVMLVSSW